jgi:hypothetical protein
MPIVKQRAYAAIGLSGVIGDGGCRKISQGTWETREGGDRSRQTGAPTDDGNA